MKHFLKFCIGIAGENVILRQHTKLRCHAQEAAQRKQDFEVGVFADPVYFGQFPDSVRARVPYLPDIPDKLVKCLLYSIVCSVPACLCYSPPCTLKMQALSLCCFMYRLRILPDHLTFSLSIITRHRKCHTSIAARITQ